MTSNTRYHTITITGHATQETRYVVTPAADAAEALADAIEALDPWSEHERRALVSAFSSDYVDFFTYESEV